MDSTHEKGQTCERGQTIAGIKDRYYAPFLKRKSISEGSVEESKEDDD